MKFAIAIKLDEVVRRDQMKETMEAFIEALNDPEVKFLRFEFIDKPKKGKTKVNVMEFPISV